MNLKRSGVEKMKEENDVDSFFDDTFNNEDLIKKAKRKGNFRITGISLFVSICVLILIILLKLQLTPFLMHKKIVEKELYYELYGANVYTGPWEENYKLVGSTATAPKYKLLDGNLVNLGDVSLTSSVIETTVGKSKFEQFSYDGHRVMNFFHPALNYSSYVNDLDKLAEVNDGKLIEMGISFDKSYSYDEVVEMLPRGVKLQWNWVNTFSQDELNTINETNEENKEYATNFKASEVLGFPTIAKDGEQIENPVESFISTVNDASDQGGSYKEEFEVIHSSIKNKKVQIVGVVVVGDKQQLVTLKNKNYIKSSSFGAIVDEY